MKDMVVLVDEKNTVLGTAEKLITHNAHTPLHRGFSVFLFNQKKELLLQQRGFQKKTWPGVWSNSCCGHPKLRESSIAAAKRRLAKELGITKANIFMVLPQYRYRFEKDNIVENEICPVMIAFSSQDPVLNKQEVEKLQWIPWEKWYEGVTHHPDFYSPWSVEETLLLTESKVFQDFLQSAKR
jgi:isopentenyl-diphosphate delta-isomerase